MGCGCKKKNQDTTPNSTIKITEGQGINQHNSMDIQVEELIKKIDEIKDNLEEETTQE